ncbi:mitochondrial amidoxime-reducing component 1-like isoform X2 [Tubulanus polymorphus]|uniref:mitochondrial amidoxime-reducing component 1-like isoform X2 n=1 Tax=Tubulanus polymorphus TaxID=672921 RepID=UPI003DA5F8D6
MYLSGRLMFYLLTNSEYRRLNIRMEPTMALIEASIHGDDVHFDAPGMNTLILPKHIKPTTENQFECTIKDKLHRGIDCGLEAGLWFSTYLKRENLKFIIPDKMLNEIRPFSNFYFINPQMVLCQSSVDDLNSRLENYETTVREFRPNVVITGPSAYSEDDWEEMQIGDIHYKMTEPCLRCLITTVKAETGVRNPTIEPLKTLRKYRMLPTHPAGPVLGRYCENTTTGEIRVGDPVYIIRRRQSTA